MNINEKEFLTPIIQGGIGVISRALIEAVKGNWEDGLFFTGANAGRINRMYTVKELMEEIDREYKEAMA